MPKQYTKRGSSTVTLPHDGELQAAESAIRRPPQDGSRSESGSEPIAKMFAADGQAHGLAADGGPLRGPPAFETFHHAFLSAFPDLKVKSRM
jgi:hypothetical protein